jgi:hypothetical protein
MSGENASGPNKSNIPGSSHGAEPVSCHHERHMSGVVLKVYNLFYRMAKKTPDGSVSFSNPVIARMINGGDRGGQRSGNYLSRVKTALVRAGLFEPLGVRKNKQTGIWMGGRYIPVPHNEWAKNQTKTLGHSPCFPRPVIVRVEKNNSPSTSKTTSSKQKDAVAPSAPGIHTPCAPWTALPCAPLSVHKQLILYRALRAPVLDRLRVVAIPTSFLNAKEGGSPLPNHPPKKSNQTKNLLSEID